ncbi:hypothetical protein C5167_000507 [Papaver somniferum]|uniref:MLO-like protein n=1 Tax=Papaver somniferum TaxID=3469 RepID=A0A4Y7KVL9_PAPSO|nr:hypothetical protein C5167_000507 [Papaver somniferum]
MAGSGTTYDRSLEETPTWAVAVVCFGIVSVSIIIEHVLELIGEWFHKKHKKALYEALLVVKTELMLLGFISLLLTFTQDYIIQLCIPKKVGNTWHPCPRDKEVESENNYAEKYCGKKAGSYCECLQLLHLGKVPLVSKTAIHQLHIFIFVLAVCHVLYCIFTMALGRAKMKKWNSWEKETKSAEYQFTHDPDRFRYARDTTFGRRHMSIWSRSTILLWITCFFRQFVRSVPKVDYLTLRHGFITAHLAPQSAVQFDFQKYMRRSLDEDFKVVVGISPVLWFFSLLFLMACTNGDYNSKWVYMYKIEDMWYKGQPTVEPTDDLFWFGSPRLILYLIHLFSFKMHFNWLSSLYYYNAP